MYKILKLVLLNSFIFLICNSTEITKHKEVKKTIVNKAIPVVKPLHTTAVVVQKPTLITHANATTIPSNKPESVVVTTVVPPSNIIKPVANVVATSTKIEPVNKPALVLPDAAKIPAKVPVASTTPIIATLQPLKCEQNQVLYNNSCGYCPSDSTYDKDNKKCICNDANFIIGKGTIVSEGKTYFQCIPCPENLVANTNQTECICKNFNTDKGLHCNNYSTNQLKFDRKEGSYSCNNPEQVAGFDYSKNMFKCYNCPEDAKFDKVNNTCICSKPDAKNPKNNIMYSPTVENDKLVCNPNVK